MGRGRAKAKQAVQAVVPDLRSLTVAEAEAVAAGAGLAVIGPDATAVRLLRGVVVAQHPEAGTRTPRGAFVTVWTAGPGGGAAGVREPVVPPLLRREPGAAAERSE